eukprot:6179461-Pleurochrysis_carterae.AAC.7
MAVRSCLRLAQEDLRLRVLAHVGVQRPSSLSVVRITAYGSAIPFLPRFSRSTFFASRSYLPPPVPLHLPLSLPLLLLFALSYSHLLRYYFPLPCCLLPSPPAAVPWCRPSSLVRSRLHLHVRLCLHLCLRRFLCISVAIVCTYRGVRGGGFIPWFIMSITAIIHLYISRTHLAPASKEFSFDTIYCTAALSN